MTEEVLNTETTISARPTFTGRYANLQAEAYSDAKRLLKLSDKQAERLAKAIAPEMGRLATQCQSLKIGKLNKDGCVTVREAASLKGVTLTHCLSLIKLLSELQELTKYGVEKYDKITLKESLVEWLDN